MTSKISCKDLGVHASKDLSYSKLCGIISLNAHFRKHFQQSFSCKYVDFSVFIFCSYIRPLVEYNSVMWSPHLLCNIDRIEKVQRKFIKSLQDLHNMSYPGKLECPKLENLELRRTKADLIFVHN